MPAVTKIGLFAGTRRVHFWEDGHSRASATSPDANRAYSVHLKRASHGESPCKQEFFVAYLDVRLTPSFARERAQSQVTPYSSDAAA